MKGQVPRRKDSGIEGTLESRVLKTKRLEEIVSGVNADREKRKKI